MPSDVPHVAVLVETSRSYGRGLLRGVKQYMAERGPWSVYMELRGLDSAIPGWLKGWRGDGILTRTGSQELADIIRKSRVPAVELRATKLRHDLPFVGADNRALGRLVAEHLIDRGFRHFGLYGIDTEDYFQERRDNFVQTVSDAGFECARFDGDARSEKPVEWERQQNSLARWVARLPKPVGVMACTDQLGFWLLDACKRAGLSVPEQVAVVGVENDESLSQMATPPLSSVQFNGERTGYEAAALLARMMDGAPPPETQTLIPPAGVVTRQSSDIIAIDDPLVADALRFIRERACAGISVRDVLRAVPVSRSFLERRMRELLGRTPKVEILRVQLLRVRELLAETDLGLTAIAYKTGFKHPQYLSTVFKREFHETPGVYRARHRASPPLQQRKA